MENLHIVFFTMICEQRQTQDAIIPVQRKANLIKTFHNLLWNLLTNTELILLVPAVESKQVFFLIQKESKATAPRVSFAIASSLHERYKNYYLRKISFNGSRLLILRILTTQIIDYFSTKKKKRVFTESARTNNVYQ